MLPDRVTGIGFDHRVPRVLPPNHHFTRIYTNQGENRAIAGSYSRRFINYMASFLFRALAKNLELRKPLKVLRSNCLRALYRLNGVF